MTCAAHSAAFVAKRLQYAWLSAHHMERWLPLVQRTETEARHALLVATANATAKSDATLRKRDTTP